jgi:hypothetical protein
VPDSSLAKRVALTKVCGRMTGLLCSLALLIFASTGAIAASGATAFESPPVLHALMTQCRPTA